MKRWLIIIGVVLGLVFLVWFVTRPDPLEVTVVSPSLGLVENTVANTRSGTVKSCQRSRLSFAIGGQIATLNVSEGDQVKKDQLLMSLWHEDRAARLAQAKSQLISSRNDKKSICISASSDEKEAKRLDGLVKQKLVSAERADLANAKAAASSASCHSAAARIKQAEAEVTLSEALLAQTQLTAPFDGIVAEVTGEIGEYSTPSPPGVATPPAIDLLTDYCHYISAPIDEVDASAIKVGMPVRVSLDAYRGQAIAATVRRIAPYILDQEKQARTVEIEAEFDQLDENITLLAGYSADMEIILQANDNVLRIPTELIFDDQYVYIVNEEKKLEKRAIDVGLTNWRFTEVSGGLSKNDRVIVNLGSKGIAEGVKVKISKSPE